MSITRYTATKDNTISNAYKEDLSTTAVSSSMGGSDVLEIFSIYGQQSDNSVEKSRVIIQFPVEKILESRSLGQIPASGSVNFHLNLSNVKHPETLAKQTTISLSPLLQAWSEGDGLDMESYSDVGASNWLSASSQVLWSLPGGINPHSVESHLNSPSTIYEFSSSLDSGTEDVSLDITSLVEDWIRHESSSSLPSKGSIQITGPSAVGNLITLHTTDGQQRNFIFSTSSNTQGKNVYFQNDAGDTDTTRNNLLAAIVGTNLFTATSEAGSSLSLTQSLNGRFGDTKITTNAAVSKVDFAGGTGVINNGLLVKLSGSFESGANSRSYYTKRFSSRSSEYFFKKPYIEARFDSSIQDDRLNLITSNPALTAAQNSKTIYYHNYVNGVLTDLDTSPKFILAVDQALTTSAVFAKTSDHNATGSGANAEEITSDKVPNTTGVYSATFKIANNTNKTFLYEKWFKADGTLLRGHPSNPLTVGIKNYYDIVNQDSNYVVNILNLQNSYRQEDQVKFRIYTRKKSRNPNVYTVASSKASVDNIKEGWYKIVRVADNLEVIGYSTGSSPSHSKLSYDVSGSYFDLDMGILEKNYLYEISLLRKDQNRYVELQEKFRFRVD